MKAGFILAFPVALIVWYSANHYGVGITYPETVVGVLLAKVGAMYLKNDVSVELNVVKSESKSKGDE